LLAKFFYPDEYLGFEFKWESIVEYLAFSAIVALALLPFYCFIFKQNSIKVKAPLVFEYR